MPDDLRRPGPGAFSLALKDQGPVGNALSPSPTNAITITRYHVSYRRADGRNTPGVDVPYAFDGAVTVTISGTAATVVGFQLVRIEAKEEAPLVQLRSNARLHHGHRRRHVLRSRPGRATK